MSRKQLLIWLMSLWVAFPVFAQEWEGIEPDAINPPIPTGDGEDQEVHKSMVVDSRYPMKLEWQGLIQAWLVTSDKSSDQFKIRRSEIKLKGAFNDNTTFVIMVDPSKVLSENKTVAGTTIRQPKKDSSILQDLVVSWRGLSHIKLSIGQMKRPVSLEGMQSSSEQVLLDRAMVSRELADKRDIGVQAEGEVAPIKIHYIIGVFNGEGPNTADTNDQKDVAEMVIWKPTSEVQLCASAYEGTQGVQTEAQNRYSEGCQIAHGPILIRAEYLQAKDANIEKEGHYILGSYRLNNWGYKALDPVRVSTRYEEWDANTHDPAEAHIFTVGTQYFLDPEAHAQIGVDYFYQDGKGGEKDTQGLSFGFQGKF